VQAEQRLSLGRAHPRRGGDLHHLARSGREEHGAAFGPDKGVTVDGAAPRDRHDRGSRYNECSRADHGKIGAQVSTARPQQAHLRGYGMRIPTQSGQ
jgi:hypothetical protein